MCIRDRAYYQTHRELIEAEMEEEKHYLLSQGVDLEPGLVLSLIHISEPTRPY